MRGGLILKRLRERTKATKLVLQLGSRGAMMLNGLLCPYHVHTCPVERCDPIGAGETLLAVTTLSSASGADDRLSLRRGVDRNGRGRPFTAWAGTMRGRGDCIPPPRWQAREGEFTFRLSGGGTTFRYSQVCGKPISKPQACMGANTVTAVPCS